MRFKLISVGRERADPAVPLVQDYLKRIAKIIPIDDVVLRADRAERLETRIFKESAESRVVVGLDERGEAMDSHRFAALVSSWMDTGASKVSFIIGGAEGLLPEVRRRSDMLLSLSKMTLPHRLARLLLAEQLYRALCIIRNTPYQK